MKKTLSILLCVLIVLACGVLFASAEEGESVYVTIVDKDGNLAVAVEAVTVTDSDEDGALTINDALYCAHEAYYEGGAAEGYASHMTEYGLSLDKLWGNANGGSYGYYVNGAAAMSLGDAVNAGDHVYAFTYTDLTAWSDKFSTFDQFYDSFDDAAEVTLTLTYVAEYDENYQPVFRPLANAEILRDGEATGITTDENGKATVLFDAEENNQYTAIISARCDGVLITPPVFKAVISGPNDLDEGAAEDPDPTGEEENPGEEDTAGDDETPANDETPDGEDGAVLDDDTPEAAPTGGAVSQATPDEATPDESGNGSNNPNAIQTGSPSILYVVIIVLAALAVAIVMIRKKNEN